MSNAQFSCALKLLLHVPIPPRQQRRCACGTVVRELQHDHTCRKNGASRIRRHDGLTACVRRHVVLADAGYGDSAEFRDALAQRELRYVVAVNGEPVVQVHVHSTASSLAPSRSSTQRWRSCAN